MLKYLEQINCVQTIVVLAYKQISFDSFKKRITNKPLTI